MTYLPELYRDVDRLFTGDNWARAALAHAMVDLGLIVRVECGADLCLEPTRAFSTVPGGGWVSFDHIVPQRAGGVHRPENLRLVHRRCNSGWATGVWEWTDARRAHVLKLQTAGQTPESNAKRSAALKGRPKSADHRAATRDAMANVDRVACPRMCGLITIAGGPMTRHLNRKIPCTPIP